MTDWRKLLTDEHLWDYRCKAVPVPLVREIVEEVETLRQDLAAARATIDTMQGGYDRAAKMILDLRSDLAAARAEREHFKNCISAREVRAMVDERNKAWSDLAAVRALLEQCLPHIRGNVGAWEQIRPKLGPDGQRSTDHAIAEGRALLAAIDTALGRK